MGVNRRCSIISNPQELYSTSASDSARTSAMETTTRTGTTTNQKRKIR